LVSAHECLVQVLLILIPVVVLALINVRQR
jgi:hypothetical protein